MSVGRIRLYELLPAIHRTRDVEQGRPVAALLGVMEEQLALLEEDVQQLYDDQFIETCADWVAPYLGDLIGYRQLHGVAAAISSPRAEVANTIRYRRRKGTASMLEQLAHDVTDWDVRTVEFFEWLAWNQYMQHTRVSPPRGGTLDLRDHDTCERVSSSEGAFDSSVHGIDVRRISMGLGRYGLRNVGLFIWRLRAFAVVRSDARELAEGYTFHPVGLDAPLFNQPQAEKEFTHLAEERNVPALLRRRPLYDELLALRAAVAGAAPSPVYFGDRPVFEIRVNRRAQPIPLEQVLICNLQEWHAPPDEIEGQRIRVAVDPELGRLTFAKREKIQHVQVSFAYGCPAAMGGGPYDRLQSLAAMRDREVKWQAQVSKALAPIPGKRFATLAEAIDAWNAQPNGTFGVITILDSASYTENLVGSARIEIPAGSRLLLGAEDGERPHVLGDVSVLGTAPADGADAGELFVNGLLIEGGLSVLVGNLGALLLEHCTVVPERGKLLVNASAADPGKRNHDLVVTLKRSICGPIAAGDAEISLQIADSIVHNGAEDDDSMAIEATGASAEVQRSTVIGAASVMHLEARNSIFSGLLSVVRRQSGCVGFSYLPMDSRSPRRHRCQPDLELEAQVARAQKLAPLPAPARDALRASIGSWMKPAFTSRNYGSPGFGQLRLTSPVEVRAGADDEAEMGAFHDLFQPQRETNLRVRLEEYLRFGFEAGVVFVT